MDAGPRVFPPYGSARLQPAKRLPAVGSRYGTLFFIGVVWGLQLARVHAPPCEQCYFVIPADSWRAVCIPAVAGVALTAGPDLLKRVRSRTVALAVASLLASVAHTAIRFPHNCFLAIAPHAIVPAASVLALVLACVQLASYAEAAAAAAAGGVVCMYIAAAMARTSSAGLPALLAIPSGCAWGVSKWFIGEVDSLGAFFLQDAEATGGVDLAPAGDDAIAADD